MQLRVTFDRAADAAYIYLRELEPRGVDQTIPCDDVPVYLDLNKQGRLVGIEILGATAILPEEVIRDAERL